MPVRTSRTGIVVFTCCQVVIYCKKMCCVDLCALHFLNKTPFAFPGLFLRIQALNVVATTGAIA